MNQTLDWVIIGADRGGLARRDAIQRDPKSRLVGVFLGKHARDCGVRVFNNLRDAVNAGDAVAVCSPAPWHPVHVAAALTARRHTLVSAPLADTFPVAKSLFEQAKAVDRVLHVSHPTLLSPASRTLRALTNRDAIHKISYTFESHGAPDMIGREIAQNAGAHLHQLVDLAGPIASIDDVEGPPGRLEVIVSFESGAQGQLVMTQGPYTSRRLQMEVQAVDANWTLRNRVLLRNGAPQTLLQENTEVEEDHAYCMRGIMGGKSHYVTEERLFHVLKLVDTLQAGRLGPTR